MAKHISRDCKCNSKTYNSNRKWNNETCHCECKNYRKWKKDYHFNPNTCTSENSKDLTSTADTSVISCHEILSVMDIVSTKMTNTIATNVTKNCHSKKVRHKIDCYILHTVLLVIILLYDYD